MVKKRPRHREPVAVEPAVSKLDPEHWRERLFRNTYTYKGKRRVVKGWSVKIQFSGRRKTFALGSSELGAAAEEACKIYKVISTQGWAAAAPPRPVLPGGSLPRPEPPPPIQDGSWKRRLVHRPYPTPDASKPDREWSVRIQSAGVSRYFPLCTSDERRAGRKAMEIHRVVLEQGLDAAFQRYPREETVAFRWLDDPLAWTYTTLHTLTSPAVQENKRAAERYVVVIEPDRGLRLALAACVSHQRGFHCSAAFVDATEASREINRQKADIALVNHSLSDGQGANCLEHLRRIRPGLVGLLYSVFEDSEQLFKNTPGGATGYMLKRTAFTNIFEPLAETTGKLEQEQLDSSVRSYFQRLVSIMPSGSSSIETSGLTPRELEVLALLSKGTLTKEIATALRISTWTVHGHVKNIFEKLGVHSRTEAVVRYLQK